MTSFFKLFSAATLILGLGSIILYPHVNTAQPSNNTFQQKVAENAIQEWISFNAPNRPVVRSQADVALLEREPLEYRKCQTINRYWAVVPVNQSGDNKPPSGDSCKLNIPPTPQGKGQIGKWNEYPWSAAFISYIMQKSGAGNQFKYSGRHATYIVDSVKNRDTQNYPFRGYPIDQKEPEIGDLICAPRGSSKDLVYDKILQEGDFTSHCDIVVAKNDNKNIEVIGGNVGDTVSKTIVLLNSKGYIQKTDSHSDFRPWFVVIKNTLRP
ncbi:DUF2272 domain-containing protein [Crocosphaera sp. UHCC 0190]|uniref:DUF2272 domain-containing protein n=1 Tax=Crocosphaera sp. UHCC 0190 TaxID=3110246 RepID=UPI002B2129A3|nr:DUF2272 domain-containing protein [Crocosphaera sp. UHCC 0190]MEA5511845.1 DUF2272 domain-containing protein [Crocosphaera sp. UHCC 0190]